MLIIYLFFLGGGWGGSYYKEYSICGSIWESPKYGNHM